MSLLIGDLNRLIIRHAGCQDRTQSAMKQERQGASTCMPSARGTTSCLHMFHILPVILGDRGTPFSDCGKTRAHLSARRGAASVPNRYQLDRELWRVPSRV